MVIVVTEKTPKMIILVKLNPFFSVVEFSNTVTF